jgi:hypothetical protein
MSITLDPTQLTDAQLEALSLLDPEAADGEKKRRSAYGSITEFFSDLAQAGLDIEAVIETHRTTKAVQAVKGTKMLNIIRRGLAYADHNGIAYEQPVLKAPEAPEASE